MGQGPLEGLEPGYRYRDLVKAIVKVISTGGFDNEDDSNCSKLASELEYGFCGLRQCQANLQPSSGTNSTISS